MTNIFWGQYLKNGWRKNPKNLQVNVSYDEVLTSAMRISQINQAWCFSTFVKNAGVSMPRSFYRIIYDSTWEYMNILSELYPTNSQNLHFSKPVGVILGHILSRPCPKPNIMDHKTGTDWQNNWTNRKLTWKEWIQKRKTPRTTERG